MHTTYDICRVLYFSAQHLLFVCAAFGILIFVCAAFAQIRRLRKSPQYLLAVLHEEMLVSASIRKTSAATERKKCRSPGSRNSLGPARSWYRCLWRIIAAPAKVEITEVMASFYDESSQWEHGFCEPFVLAHSSGEAEASEEWAMYIYIYIYISVYIYIYTHRESERERERYIYIYIYIYICYIEVWGL